MKLEVGQVTDEYARRAFQRVAATMVDGNGLSVLRFGTATLTWAAAALSATLAIPHGLGGSPVVVQLTPDATFGASWRPALNGFDATNVNVSGFSSAGVQTGTATVYWLAGR